MVLIFLTAAFRFCLPYFLDLAHWIGDWLSLGWVQESAVLPHRDKTSCFIDKCLTFLLFPVPALFPWHADGAEDMQDGAFCEVPEVSSDGWKFAFFYKYIVYYYF